MSNVLLDVKGLGKAYIDGQKKTSVFTDVSFSVLPQQMVSIVGESGSGKSSLLHIIASLDSPSSGSVFFESQDLFAMSSISQARFRNINLGFIYQFHHLLSEFNVVENVSIPAWIAGKDKKETNKRAKMLLDMVGLSHRLDYIPSQLSGGERQRVAIARALVNKPKLLIADEPTGNLDSNIGHEVYKLLLSCVEQEGSSLILVTHDLNLAQKMHKKFLLKNHELREI